MCEAMQCNGGFKILLHAMWEYKCSATCFHPSSLIHRDTHLTKTKLFATASPPLPST